MIKKHLITLLTITTIFSSFPLTVYGAQDESPAKDEMMEEIRNNQARKHCREDLLHDTSIGSSLQRCSP